MNYRRLGKTELMVSEIGLGAELLERMTPEETGAIIETCEAQGINILDCWMSEPNVRSAIGNAIAGHREKWYIQGHIGSTWQDGQYVRSRKVDEAKVAFQDILDRMQTDYIDLGMIHYVDSIEDWNEIINGPFIEYVHELKEKGIVKHVGMSSHNPQVAKLAVLSGEIEMLMFSINPAFDLIPPTENVDDLFGDLNKLVGTIDPERVELYRLCEQHDVGITVMKGFCGGRLFNPDDTPFGKVMTPIQCAHYCLTRPAVASVLCGVANPDQVIAAAAYSDATPEEKDYSEVLASAPANAFSGKCMYCNHCKPCPMDIDIAMVNKLYDLATMQAEVLPSIKSHYELLPVNAADCIGCGGCETRCPFGVPVVERMEKAKELFA